MNSRRRCRNSSIRIDTTSLDLPFWLFRLEEFTEVLFRGRETVPEEVDLLRELIPLAKQAYRNPGGSTQLRRGGDGNALTADTPVPYRMADLLKLIDERMGLLDSKNDRPVYRALQDPHRRRRSATRATASCSIRG